MKNFLAGLLLGWAAAYWYYTQSAYVREVASILWTRASAPPPSEQPKAPVLYNPGASPYPSRP